MLNQIRKSSPFQSDLKRYDELLLKITDESTKIEIKQLISNLVNEVKKMDDLHLELIFNKQMRTTGSDCREKITNIRKQLESKFKEHKVI